MAYQYENLSSESFEIRLLTIEAAEDETNDPIRLRLEYYRLDSKPKYLALSYTWSRPSPTAPAEADDEEHLLPVHINDKEYKVRLNLHDALRHLRSTWKADMRWWIDAICINQQSIPERNAQVARMKDIYANSRFTVIWLGLENELTCMAADKVKQIGNSWKLRDAKLRSMFVANADLQRYGDVVRKEFDGNDTVKSWEAIRDLFDRSWWKRAWVVQEICASPSAQIQIGLLLVSWFDLLWTRYVITQHSSSMQRVPNLGIPYPFRTIGPLLDDMTPVTDLNSSRDLYRSGERTSVRLDLVTLLSQFRRRFATDARDKIYSLVGISDCHELVTIDYALPVEAVYSQFAKKLIETTKSLRILGSCNFPARLAHLPTWAPDWTDTKPCDRIGLPQEQFKHWRTKNNERVYSATKDSTLDVHFEDNDRVMVTKAGLFDKIDFTSDDYWSLDNDKDNSADTLAITFQAILLQKWAEIQSSASEGLVYIDGEALKSTSGAEESGFLSQIYKPTHENLFSAYLGTLAVDAVVDTVKGHDVRISQSGVDVLARLASGPNMAYVLTVRAKGRAFAVSHRGAFAFVPDQTLIGDAIAFVQGSELPYILRPSEDGFKLIGECYVHGFMDGEAWSDMERNSKIKQIRIV